MSHVVHATGQPVSYNFSRVWWRGVDLNHRRHTPTDLQSVPFGHSGTPPFWSWRRDLNPQPADYKSAALPIELRQPPKREWVSEARGICQVTAALTATTGSTGREARSLPCSTGGGKPFFPVRFIFLPLRPRFPALAGPLVAGTGPSGVAKAVRTPYGSRIRKRSFNFHQ